MNITIWDIETSPIKGYFWGLYPKSINHNHIIEDYRILCVCWKELGSKTTKSVDILQEGEVDNDYNVVKTVHEMLQNVDVLVGHNGDKFDLKMFNAKVIEYGLPPLPRILTIDTLKAVRQISRHTSNRLDYLGHKHGLGRKEDTGGFGLWVECMQGDKKAMKKMVKYCKRDVVLLEEFYIKLRPHMKSHPVVNDFEKFSCPRCNSEEVVKHKPRITSTGILRQQYQCNSCGGYFTPRNNIVRKTETKI